MKVFDFLDAFNQDDAASMHRIDGCATCSL